MVIRFVFGVLLTNIWNVSVTCYFEKFPNNTSAHYCNDTLNAAV